MTLIGKTLRYWRVYRSRLFLRRLADAIRDTFLPPRQRVLVLEMNKTSVDVTTGPYVRVVHYTTRRAIPSSSIADCVENGTMYERPVASEELFIEFLDRYFGLGATVWFVYGEEGVLGYQWSITGSPIRLPELASTAHANGGHDIGRAGFPKVARQRLQRGADSAGPGASEGRRNDSRLRDNRHQQYC